MIHALALTNMDLCVGSRLLLLAAIVGMTVSSSPGQALESDISGKVEQSHWPVGDPRRCQELMRQSKFDVKRFEAMPGVGWDNLRNIEAGMVVSYSYTLCKLTDDGRLLIPDNIFTVPLKYSSVETFAELYDHWLNTSSMTSNTVNIEAGVTVNSVSVSGKFSYENEQLKSKQIEDKAVTVRVQVRYHRYEARLQPDPVLSPQFKSRLMSIAANIQLNRTEQAKYEGQLLIRDFGTHVLTSITAGAGLVKDDYLQRKFVLESTDKKSSILATASVSFMNIFKFSASYGHATDQKMAQSYEQSLTHSYIKSHGGPIIHAANMTINEWVDGVDDNLVAMDRAGDPLYFLVTPTLLPELPMTTVEELEKIVRQSTELYYEMNTIAGCTKLDAPNFSFSANFDDGSCHSKPTNLTFGGVYQQCTVSGNFLYHSPCDGLNVVNPKTGDFSCPSSYKAIKIQSGRSMGQTENKRKCTRYFIFFHRCHTEQVYSEAVYSTYWCAATGKVEKESGYLFGGLYTSTTANLVTGTKGCPPLYYARRMFTDLDICICDDYELGEGFSVPFGGFFSCMAGNPLAADGVHPVGSQLAKVPAPNSLKLFMEGQAGQGIYPSRCPEGYSQHLAINDLGCSIHYCVQTGALSGPNLPPIKRPPFMPKPALIMEEQDSLVVFNYETQAWAKNEQAKELEINLTANSKSLNPSQNSANEMSPGTAAGISVCATLACVAIATMIFAVVRRRHSRGQSSYKRISDESTEPPTNYGSTRAETTTINVSA